MTKNSPAVATGALISTVGHASADELRLELTGLDAANGFANRFLFACVRRSKCLPDGGGEVDLSGLAATIAEKLTAAGRVGRLRRSEAADALWRHVYPELSEGRPGMLGAATGRAEAQVLRLSTLYALLDGKDVVEAPHLLAALELHRFSLKSAEFIFGPSLGNKYADTILDSVRASPEGVARSEIYALFGKHGDADRIAAALDLLVGRGLVTTEKVATAGRPKEVIRAGSNYSEGAKSVLSVKSLLSMGYGKEPEPENAQKGSEGAHPRRWEAEV
jgi:hypothetical protein